MNKKELRELILQELMARPAGIIKSNLEKVNINDLADVAQRSFDNILDMLDYDQQADDILKNKLKIQLSLYMQRVLDAVDSGVDPREIIQRINETLKTI
jgi:pyruvate/oxaloacetate carboxyltransferase